MPPEVWSQVSSLGISGLLFVMWWLERQERSRTGSALREVGQHGGRQMELNRHLLEVIQANTEALTALREELRAHRSVEAEWLGRLTQQLDELT